VTYTAAVVTGLVLAVALDLWVLRTKLVRTGAFWLSYALIIGFQLVSNGVLTSRQIVRYDPEAIVGFRVAYAPVEDIGFGFALVLSVLSLWARWNRTADQAES